MTKSLRSLLLFFVLPVPIAFAADLDRLANLDRLIDTVFATHQFKELALSTDGSEVAWVEQWPLNDSQYQSHIFIAAASSGTPQRVRLEGSNDQHGITWSPDGKQLAFLADEAGKGQISLHVFDTQTSHVRILGKIEGDVSSTKWSPDGSQIALLLKAPSAANEKVPGLWVHRDTVPQTLVLLNAKTGELRHIGQPDLNIYEYDWSPDARHIAATGATGDGNDNWWHASLFRVDLEDDKTTELLKPPLQIASPAWSPDGKSIAFLGGLMSDFIAPGGEVFVVSRDGGTATNVTPGLAGSATGLSWKKATEILFSEDIEGETAVGSAGVSGKDVRTLWRGSDNISTGGLVSGLAVGVNGSASAVIRQSFSRAPEIWMGEIGQWRQLTHVNSSLKPAWGESQSVHWKNHEQAVQGWLIFPMNYNPGHKYPMVVVVHGGPAGDSASKWARPFYNMEVLSGQGYFVFFPNARGSLGFGEAFTQANVKDIGYGDFRDITDGVESLLGKLPIDRNRIGITGWSYGGYMAMWAITQTNLFKASVAGPGVSNWQSYYGQVDVENWVIPYFGASVYDNPEIYARSSPINYIAKAHTPTLFYAGDVDGICPTPQSFELWRGLEHKNVPTSFVIYHGETHGLVMPKNQRAVTVAAAEWFEKYLPASDMRH